MGLGVEHEQPFSLGEAILPSDATNQIVHPNVHVEAVQFIDGAQRPIGDRRPVRIGQVQERAERGAGQIRLGRFHRGGGRHLRRTQDQRCEAAARLEGREGTGCPSCSRSRLGRRSGNRSRSSKGASCSMVIGMEQAQ